MCLLGVSPLDVDRLNNIPDRLADRISFKVLFTCTLIEENGWLLLVFIYSVKCTGTGTGSNA